MSSTELRTSGRAPRRRNGARRGSATRLPACQRRSARRARSGWCYWVPDRRPPARLGQRWPDWRALRPAAQPARGHTANVESSVDLRGKAQRTPHRGLAVTPKRLNGIVVTGLPADSSVGSPCTWRLSSPDRSSPTGRHVVRSSTARRPVTMGLRSALGARQTPEPMWTMLPMRGRVVIRWTGHGWVSLPVSRPRCGAWPRWWPAAPSRLRCLRRWRMSWAG